MQSSRVASCDSSNEDHQPCPPAASTASVAPTSQRTHSITPSSSSSISSHLHFMLPGSCAALKPTLERSIRHLRHHRQHTPAATTTRLILPGCPKPSPRAWSSTLRVGSTQFGLSRAGRAAEWWNQATKCVYLNNSDEEEEEVKEG